MEELTKVLEKTVSNSQTDQNEAVKFIQDYIQRDFVGFLRTLSDVLFNQSHPPVVRAAAGLQLKNQLTARDETQRHQQQERWRQLPLETRQYIKERVFQTLGTEVFRPSAAPQCVAYIAIVELAEGLWPGLIQALIQNVTNPNSTAALKLASLETVVHLCQDIDQNRFSANDLDSILKIVIHGMGESEIEIRSAATAALLKLTETKIQTISQSYQTLTFNKLGDHLNIEPRYAEIIVAQMIREERIKGHLDQIAGIVYFDSKDIIRTFDNEILKLCSEVDKTTEKIREIVPDEWWIKNTST